VVILLLIVINAVKFRLHFDRNRNILAVPPGAYSFGRGAGYGRKISSQSREWSDFMASTNKTANLGLSQWEAADAVQMADFNADNAKIDEALGGLMAGGSSPWVKLMDVEVKQDNSKVSLDLSRIEAEGIMALEIYADLNGDYNYSMLLNGDRGDKYSYQSAGSSTIRTADFLPLESGSTEISILGRSIFLYSYTSTVYYTMSRTDFPELVSLDFLSEIDRGLVTGDRIVVWGLKK